MIDSERNLKVKCLQSDNVGEYANDDLKIIVLTVTLK